MLTLSGPCLRACAVLLLGSGAGAFFASLARAHACSLRTRLLEHQARLALHLAFLRLPAAAQTVVIAQVGVASLTVVAALLGHWLIASVGVALILAPGPWLHSKRAARVNVMEEQLDGWLRGLASSLRATPALGEALEYSQLLVAAPLRDELDLVVKEQRLGVPLDDALARMGDRISSRTVGSALSALRIGRNVGGDLPTILERSASVLREMARLEGVVRTKTAESKAQAYVIAVLPFPMIGLFTYLDPSLLSPLFESFRGHCVAALAFVLWASAIAFARRILDVDI